jgi:hypothetical protein
MNYFSRTLLAVGWIVCCRSALAEHETHLRGIINLPELQGALLEVNHTLWPSPITVTRLVKAGESFEDQTIKGAHVQFEVLEINVGTEKIKLRENGKETVYGLEGTNTSAAPSDNAPSSKPGVHLQNARFQDVLDLYSDLKNRTVLLHPTITWSPFSLQAVAQNKLAIADMLEKAFLDKGISTIIDGEKFSLLVPTSIKAAAVPHSSDLDTNSVTFGSSLIHNPLNAIVRVYDHLLGRTRSGNPYLPGPAIYLYTKQLSKAEMLYACDTLLDWNGFKVVLIGDKMYEIVQAPRSMK